MKRFSPPEKEKCFTRFRPYPCFLRSFPVTPITRAYTDLYYHRLTLLARKKAIPFLEIRDFFKKISPRPSWPRGLFRFFRYFYSSTSPMLTWFSNPVLVNFLVSSSGISSVVIIFTISSNFAKSSLLKRFLQRASTVFT